jgi:membrane-associated phospholipid phosphatase
LRILSLYVFTLETPEGIIPLVDPFLEKVAYGGNATYTKDLFFSGHTSTLFIVSLAEKRRGLRIVLIMSTILIGLLLVWQRVHYTIDVVGALLVTFAVYRGITSLNRLTFRQD